MLGWETVQKQSGLASQPSTEAFGARLSPWITFQEAGFYETPYGMFHKLQIYTIKELSPELNQSFPGSVQPVSRRPLEKSLEFKMSWISIGHERRRLIFSTPTLHYPCFSRTRTIRSSLEGGALK